MKKFITGALALTVLSSMATAGTNNFYVGGGIAYESIDGADSAGQASELHIGKEIANNFGAELKVSKTFNEAKTDGVVSWTWGNRQTELKLNLLTVGAYGTYTYSPTPTFNIIPKIGFTYLSEKATYTSSPYSDSKDNTETRLTLGVDFKYDITSDFGTYVSYTRLTSDAQHFTFGLERRF